MSSLLNSTAVGCKKGDEAGEILQAFIETNPTMALNRTVEVEKQPKGTSVGDKVVDPGR